MQIAVTDITRMQPGYVCVAGVDVATGAYVRPVIVGARLETAILAPHGGPFDLATVVDLGIVAPVPQRPEVEDHAFKPRNARAVQTIEPSLFWEMLRYLSRPTLRAIFGAQLKYHEPGRAIVELGCGEASLGCLAPTRLPRLGLMAREGRTPQVRMALSDGELGLDLAVTDIRLYGPDHVTPDPDGIDRVRTELARGTPAVLSVGLTRPYQPSPGVGPVHWLQVNNVHLESDPAWRLGAAQP